MTHTQAYGAITRLFHETNRAEAASETGHVTGALSGIGGRHGKQAAES